MDSGLLRPIQCSTSALGWRVEMTQQQRRIQQAVFTAVAPVRPGELACLRAELAQRQTARIDQDRLRKTGRIHCTRLVLLEQARSRSGQYFGPRLVLSSWFDGSQTAHLEQLTAAVPDLLR